MAPGKLFDKHPLCLALMMAISVERIYSISTSIRLTKAGCGSCFSYLKCLFLGEGVMVQFIA
jgi:hypothetical protein